MFDLDDRPSLDKKRKHSIEVVVDRFRVKAGLEQRLAESFETALELAQGNAWVLTMNENPNGDGDPIVFSSHFACHQCGYSLSELGPAYSPSTTPPEPARPAMAWGLGNSLMPSA